jgi:hypothetical protein
MAEFASALGEEQDDEANMNQAIAAVLIEMGSQSREVEEGRRMKDEFHDIRLRYHIVLTVEERIKCIGKWDDDLTFSDIYLAYCRRVTAQSGEVIPPRFWVMNDEEWLNLKKIMRSFFDYKDGKDEEDALDFLESLQTSASRVRRSAKGISVSNFVIDESDLDLVVKPGSPFNTWVDAFKRTNESPVKGLLANSMDDDEEE